MLKQLFDFGFVESGNFLFTFDDDRPFKQIRIFEHELDRLVFRRRLLLHVFLPVKRSSRVEKLLDWTVADDLFQLPFGKLILAVLALFECDFLRLQETSCFTASRSRRFVDELDSIRHTVPAT